MNLATNCKFCKNPITITLDDEYSELGDPYKLIPMASCNHCSDIRTERRKLENRISKLSRIISLTVQGDKRESLRNPLEEITKKYSELICRWHGRQGSVWDTECVNIMLEHPEKWSECLSVLWKIYFDWEKNQSTPA